MTTRVKKPTLEEIKRNHLADLEVQGRYGCRKPETGQAPFGCLLGSIVAAVGIQIGLEGQKGSQGFALVSQQQDLP